MFDFLNDETKAMLFELVVFFVLCMVTTGVIMVMMLLFKAGDWKALMLFILGLIGVVGFAWYLYSMRCARLVRTLRP